MSASSSSTFERKARGAVAEAETGGGDVTAETMRERGGGDVTAETMRERGGVQSLERAFAILEKVARHRDGVRLRELSKHLGLHTSTTFHLVKTMVIPRCSRWLPARSTRLSCRRSHARCSRTFPPARARAAISRSARATTLSCWRAPWAPARSSSPTVSARPGQPIARLSARSCLRHSTSASSPPF